MFEGDCNIMYSGTNADSTKYTTKKINFYHLKSIAIREQCQANDILMGFKIFQKEQGNC